MEKTNDELLIETMERFKELEQRYNQMTKEELVSLIVFREVMLEAVDPERHEIPLWCFVGDSSNTMYLSEKVPKCVVGNPSGAFYYTDGEVNIRVPKTMEELFPVITYGDPPVLVKLNITF